MNGETIKISYELDMDDFMAMQQMFMKRQETLKKISMIFVMFLGLFLITDIMFGPWKPQEMSELWQKLLPFVIMAVIFLGIIHSKIFIRMQRQDFIQNQKLPFLGMNHVEINNEYIKIKDPILEGKLNWENLYLILEEKKYFFLFFSTLTAYLIPKEKLGENKEEIIILIRQKQQDMIDKSLAENNVTKTL